MIVDSWGNWSETEEEAKEKILKNFRESDSYYETIGENLNIPSEYFQWIVEHCWADFKKRFADDIQMAELDWAEYYFWELKDEDELELEDEEVV